MSFDELKNGRLKNGEEITPDKLFGDAQVDGLKALLEAKETTKELHEYSEAEIMALPKEELARLSKAPQEIVEVYKQEPVDSKLYGYQELAERIISMPDLPKVPTFIDDLDEVLDGGLHGGELLVLSAPTKNGKTLICQSISYLQASRGCPNLWFTLEMSWQELTRKFMEMDVMMKASATKSPDRLPIYYPIDNRAMSLEWLETKIAEAIKTNGIKCVFIDHLHFLVPLDTQKANISFLVGGIVRAVKRIAVKLDIPIILIAHTKKLDVNVTPDINSMRDSSFIAQESDFTVVMWRERLDTGRKQGETENMNEVYSDRTFVSVEANRRNGKTKKFALGMINGRFHGYADYLNLMQERDHATLVSHMNDEEDKLRKAQEAMKSFGN